MTISRKIAEAYKKSSYWIMLPDGVLLFKPAKPEKALDKLHKQYHVKSSALISAWNPHSKPATNKENKEAAERLARDLKKYPAYFTAEGSEASSGKKAERSFFVLGILRDDALRLAKKYKQNAIVFCSQRKGEVYPRLIAARREDQQILDGSD